LYFKEKRIIKTPEEKEKLKKAIEIIDKVFFHIEELNDN
jgi:Xaa-Pro aminopeptidase